MVNVKVVLICTEPSRFVRLLARPRLPPSAARCAYTSTTNERRERKMSCLLASHDGNGGGEVKNAETSSPPTRDVRLFLPLPVPHCKHETSSSPVMALAPFAQSLPTKNVQHDPSPSRVQCSLSLPRTDACMDGIAAVRIRRAKESEKWKIPQTTKRIHTKSILVQEV